LEIKKISLNEKGNLIYSEKDEKAKGNINKFNIDIKEYKNYSIINNI
jgi:hypothetical protein